MSSEQNTRFIDTHCHLDFPEFDADRDEVIKRANSQGIYQFINIGSSIKGSCACVDLAQRYSSIYATIGVHPHEADSFTAEDEKAIRSLAKNNKVVAIGEIGLDFFRNFSQHDNQRKVFLSLIKVAKDFNLPLVIHTREAGEETLKMLKEAMPIRAVVHCFSAGEEFLKPILDLGFLVSFTCNITYPVKPLNSGRDPAAKSLSTRDRKAQNLRDIVKLVPADRLLLETDAPYLAPEGLRGKRNEPAYVRILAQEVARIREVTLDEIGRITTDNAIKFFNLK